MADMFLRDLRVAVEWLDGLVAPMPQEKSPAGFHH
jgi:glutamate decarboxylase